MAMFYGKNALLFLIEEDISKNIDTIKKRVSLIR